MARGSVTNHGTSFGYAVRLDTAEVRGRYLRRRGFARKKNAEAELTRVLDLVKVARDPDERRRTGSMIFELSRWGRPLPAVEAWRRKLEGSAGELTLGEFLDEWLAGKLDVKPTTLRLYRHWVGAYLVPHLGHIRLDSVSKVEVRAMFDASATGLSAQHEVLKLLRGALKAAVADGLIDRHQLAGFRLPRREPRELRVWTPAEVRTFLAYVRDDRLGPLFELELTTGLRVGELCGLRWEDLDGPVLRVRRQLHFEDKRPVVSTPKTPSSRRSLRLDAETLAALDRWRRRQREELFALGVRQAPDTWLFTREDGEPLRTWSLVRRLRELAEAWNLPPLRFHDLRHTYATLALRAGVSPKVVSERLGHSGIGITLDVYSTVIEELEDEATTKVRGLLGQ